MENTHTSISEAFMFYPIGLYSPYDTFGSHSILTPSGNPIGYKNPHILEYLHLSFQENFLNKDISQKDNTS